MYYCIIIMPPTSIKINDGVKNIQTYCNGCFSFLYTFPIEDESYHTSPGYTGNIDVRLVNGSSNSEGRVEVLRTSGKWGMVCDDEWDDRAAQVVCRQLGQPTADAKAVSNARFGSGEGPVFLDNVRCDGWESNLGSCSSNEWGMTDCRNSEGAGVQCSKFI